MVVVNSVNLDGCLNAIVFLTMNIDIDLLFLFVLGVILVLLDFFFNRLKDVVRDEKWELRDLAN